MNPGYYVALLDGSEVNIRTKEGANALLLRGPTANYISSTLQKIRKIRISKPRMSTADISNVNTQQQFTYWLALNADEKLFREIFSKINDPTLAGLYR